MELVFNRIMKFLLLVLSLFFYTKSYLFSLLLDYPLAKKGVLLIKQKDLLKKNRIPLSGEWEFYWESLLVPGDQVNEKEKGFFNIPDVWNNKVYKCTKLTGAGYATFRLILILPETNKTYGIYIKNLSSSYNLFFNEKLLLSNGVVGTKESISKPFFYPVLGLIENPKYTNEILLQVANFSYYRGGPWNKIFLVKLTV